MLWLGNKRGRAGAIQPLSPAHVCWEVICSKPCGCAAKIISRAIKEAPVALSVMLCQGREEIVEGQEQTLKPPPLNSRCRFDAGRGC